MNKMLWQRLCSKQMLVTLLLGFSSGLPLLLTITLLQAWLKQEGVSLSTIGLMSLIGLPYSLKFLWAPLFDRYTLPWLGRRRGWLVAVQGGVICAIFGLSFTSPHTSPFSLAIMALLLTFMSASQDTLVDAFRRETLSDTELGPGSAFFFNGYRIGMLVASSGGLILADHLTFQEVYRIMAGCMIVGVATTLWLAKEPSSYQAPVSLTQAVIEPLREYFARPHALLILSFIVLYKLGDSMASTLTTPFYLDLGFSKTEIGVTVKFFGFWATIAGGVLGAIWMTRWNIMKSLWYFGLLQMASTAGFIVLAYMGKHSEILAAVITFENLTAGMGSAAFLAFMAMLTNRQFTAFQYALLTSLMGVPRVLFAAPTGFFAEQLGWLSFFALCTIIALPGLWLLRYIPTPEATPPKDFS